MSYTNHLYAIVYPAPALVASQLSPEDFAQHYLTGGIRINSGKLIFAEIENTFRHPFFNIEKGIEGLSEKVGGGPKRTKYISSYRVLEHLDLAKIQKLYVCTPGGHTLALSPETHDYEPSEKNLRVFVEIAPLRSLVLTKFDFEEFGEFLTNPEVAQSAPAVLYTQIDFDETEFLDEFKDNPFVVPPISCLQPSRLRDAIEEMKANEQKQIKGLGLDSNFNNISYRKVRRGFMFYRRDQKVFFPFPDDHEIERLNLKFWKNI